MKKVLALVLAVVMVVGMASVATFAAAPSVTVKVGDKTQNEFETDVYKLVVEGGKEITVELKDIPSTESYKVEIKKQDQAKDGCAVALKSQNGKKYTFVTTAKATSVADEQNPDYFINIKYVGNDSGSLSDKTIKVCIGTDADNIIAKSKFEDLKEANKDATVKASINVGDIEISDITNPRDVNKVMNDDAPSAVAEALKGKNYAYAGFKYVQPLPGVGTMEIELNADLLLAGAEKVYVYEVSGDKFSLVASSADDKMFEVKDGAVKFPVSKTSQWIITDKALSSTGTGSGSSSNTNPGTGANDMVGAAVVMALVAGAGIVAFKK